LNPWLRSQAVIPARPASASAALSHEKVAPEKVRSMYWWTSKANLCSGSLMPGITVAFGVPYQSSRQA